MWLCATPLPLPLWSAGENECPSSRSNYCIQLSSRTDIHQHSNLALIDRILTFHKIRDTRCSADNKIQIVLFQRATQSHFCSWVTWRIICQCSFCGFSSHFLLHSDRDVKWKGSPKTPKTIVPKWEQEKLAIVLFYYMEKELYWSINLLFHKLHLIYFKHE